MNRRTRGQVAEFIEDAIVARGLQGSTAPFLWLKGLFGPLFERNVPMNRMSVRDVRLAILLYLILLPLVLLAVVLASPLEWQRARRLRRHNEQARALLLPRSATQRAGGSSSESGQRTVINYRIDGEGRAAFFGVALVVLTGDTKQLVGFTAHQGVPRDGITGETVRDALAAAGDAVELYHWQWNRNDPYELAERGEIPW